jgi:hypothetical protein
MRTLRQWSLAAILLAGCGSPAEPISTVPIERHADAGAHRDVGGSPDSSSPDSGGAQRGPIVTDQGGSRVELRRWTAEGDTDAGHVFHDTKLDLDCTWTPVDAGKYRCLPRDNVFYHPIRFADPLCMRPVYTFANTVCSQPPAYIRNEATLPTCPTSFVLRKRGDKLPDRSYYYRSTNGPCLSKALTDTEDLYAFGDAVPLTDFVAGTVTGGPVVNNFAQRTIEGEDGSRVIFGFHDQAGGIDCTTTTAADGSFRCLPFTVGSVGTAFSDSVCMMPARVGTKSSCAAGASYLARSTRNECSTRTSILRAGARIATGYEKFSASCSTGTAAPFLDYWSGGDEVPPSTFVTATLTKGNEPGRLKRMVIGTPAGMLPTEALWDSKLDQACSARLLMDGTYRCVGAARPNVLVSIFADAACTQPAVQDLASAGGDFCSSGYLFKADATQCPIRYHVFPVGQTPVTGPIYHLDTTGGCVVVPLDGTGPVYTLGAELTPDQFVELQPPR